MNPSTQTIFLQATEVPRDERAKFVDEACRGDARLKAAVEALLWADEHPGILTRSPVPTARLSNAAAIASAETIDVSHGMEGPGSVIGPYRLVDSLGEGGFGRVFVAEQELPVRRQVALKILKAGMDTRQIIGRFEGERQALALMDHPGIAKVFDAGTTSTGRPYFVMELVKGRPLTDFADEQRLTLRQRLELFRDVCLAVQHAHSKGIIHRDIKPSNILVVQGDDGPLPKVIDFGIAKATGARLSDKTVQTQAAQWLGTPEYMSPEQAGGGLDLDTRSDVYSLGATLYELLVGVTPFDTLRMRSVSYDMVARMIREDDPPRPSARLSRMGDDAGAMADKRKTDAPRLAGALKGDLDWIVMRAIEKDPSRRYETAAALAADIQRFLDDKPVEARPPTTSYQVAKWVRRNRGAFIAACAVGAAIVLGVAGLGVGLLRAEDSARQARLSAQEAKAEKERAEREAAAARAAEAAARTAESEARRAEDTARASQRDAQDAAQREREAATLARNALQVVDRQRRRSQAVESFIQNDMLGSENSDEPLHPGYTVREMVENAERRLDQGSDVPPDFEAAIRHTIGLLFIRVGDYARAESNLRRSVELMQAQQDRDQPNYADALDALGVVLNYLSRVDDAQQYHEQALAIRQEYEPDNLKALASSYANLAGAAADRGQFPVAERLYRQVLDLHEQTGIAGSADDAQTRINLGMVLAGLHRIDDAEDMLRQGIAMAAESSGERSALVGTGQSLLGEMLIDAGRREDAVEPLRAALSIRAEIFGPAHRFAISVQTLLGRALLATDPDSGIAELVAAAQAAHDSLPIEDTYRLNAEQRLAMAAYQLGRNDLAEHWMSGLRPLMDYHFTDNPRGMGGYLAAYADVLLALGGRQRFEEGERVARECLALRTPAYRRSDPNFWLIEQSRATLGEALADLGDTESDPSAAIARYTEAESLLTRAINDMHPPEASAARLRRAIERLIAMYESWDRLTPGQGIADRAARFRERLDPVPQPNPS